eukprot:206014-Lingulodinium_polyedra.AAC.1
MGGPPAWAGATGAGHQARREPGGRSGDQRAVPATAKERSTKTGASQRRKGGFRPQPATAGFR